MDTLKALFVEAVENAANVDPGVELELMAMLPDAHVAGDFVKTPVTLNLASITSRRAIPIKSHFECDQILSDDMPGIPQGFSIEGRASYGASMSLIPNTILSLSDGRTLFVADTLKGIDGQADKKRKAARELAVDAVLKGFAKHLRQ